MSNEVTVEKTTLSKLALGKNGSVALGFTVGVATLLTLVSVVVMAMTNAV